MFMEMAVTLTVAAIMLEMMLVYRFRLLLEIFERNMMLGMAFSLVLSWVLGEAFGAAGMTVLLAAAASTVATGLVYKSGALVTAERLIARF